MIGFLVWFRGLPGLARAGCILTGVGGVTLALLTVGLDPATAGPVPRLAATTAFAAAQGGLVLVMIAAFRRLYVRATVARKRK